MNPGLLNWVTFAQSLLTSAAIIAGGVWAYFHYLRRRTYFHRINLALDSMSLTINGKHYVLMSYSIDNHSLTKVVVDHNGSAIRVHALNEEGLSLPVQSVDWIHLGTFDVFQSHAWLEPSEIIEEEQLIALNEHPGCVKIELIVSSEKHFWDAIRILHIDKEQQNERERLSGL